MSRVIGANIENIASKYLQTQGIKIISKNFLCRQGEIDIIGQQQDVIIFFEVKFRRNRDFGCALEAITKKKQQKLISAAKMFILKNSWINNLHLRFDAIACYCNLQQRKYQLHWLKNIIQLNY